VPLVTIAVVYRLIYLSQPKVLHLSMEEIGIPTAKVDRKWFIIGLLLPLTILVDLFAVAGPIKYSPNTNQARIYFSARLYFCGRVFTGHSGRMIFRGLLMHLIAKRFGMTVAVVGSFRAFAPLHLVNGALDAASMLMYSMEALLYGICSP